MFLWRFYTAHGLRGENDAHERMKKAAKPHHKNMVIRANTIRIGDRLA